MSQHKIGKLFIKNGDIKTRRKDVEKELRWKVSKGEKRKVRMDGRGGVVKAFFMFVLPPFISNEQGVFA